eukprot:9920057-Alexandrium_andersonii.AAC.1
MVPRRRGLHESHRGRRECRGHDGVRSGLKGRRPSCLDVLPRTRARSEWPTEGRPGHGPA